jgi:thioredoxin-related protein
MKVKKLLYVLIIMPFMAFMQSTNSTGPVSWLSFEDAVTASQQEQKKIFIDVYTDWCGWCKRMDATTFSNPAVAEMLQSNFYPVKLNAEQREPITFDEHTFNFIPRGTKGYHELAATLLNGKLSYPSVVFLNEKFEIIQVLPGYRKAGEFLKIITFIGEDHYLTTSWEDFSKTYEKGIGPDAGNQ